MFSIKIFIVSSCVRVLLLIINNLRKIDYRCPNIISSIRYCLKYYSIKPYCLRLMDTDIDCRWFFFFTDPGIFLWLLIFVRLYLLNFIFNYSKRYAYFFSISSRWTTLIRKLSCQLNAYFVHYPQWKIIISITIIITIIIICKR